jgi:hypothetical protein
MTKVCTKCGTEKPLESFGNRKGKHRKDGDRHAECKDCTNDYRRKRYATNPDARSSILSITKKSFEKLKDEVLAAYGNKCSCCGESERDFLTMDHIAGNGAEHRREIGEGSKRLYQFLKKNNFPSGFQVLCYNCNCAKGHRGVCPHKRTDVLDI